jgi:hypothetical protein
MHETLGFYVIKGSGFQALPFYFPLKLQKSAAKALNH